MSKYDFCMGCMSPLEGGSKCRKCGYDQNMPPKPGGLKPGTLLAERFVAGAVIARNGEGLTYIGRDMENNRKVTITEFFPENLCRRKDSSDALVPDKGCEGMYSDYLSDFLDVHRAVARVSDMAAIVPLIDLFECNSTAYAVYQHISGKTFSELMKRADRLTWDEARPIFMPLVSALVQAQKLGLVHFAINPENIIMNNNGELMLKGFGVPDARIAETDLKADLSDGFSAFEQYSAEGEKGTWTDVYSIAAVMLYALTGKRPPDAISRSYESRLNIPSSLASEIPTHVISAIAKALQVRVADRTQTMEQFYEALSSSRRKDSGLGFMPQQRPQQPQRQPQQRQPQPQRQPQRQPQPERRPEPQRGGSGGAKPWYKNLNQFQYWILTTLLAILILGTIAVIIFFAIKPKITGDKPVSTVTYKEDNTVASLITDTDAMYEVPKLVGKSWEEVSENVEYRAQLSLMETRSEYSDDYPAGVIIRQSIAPGTMVKSRTPIAVTVSLGSQRCKIPNIIGMTVAEADSELTKAGLRLGEQTEEYNDSLEAGRVIAIVGGSVGDSVERGSAVDIKVSLGREG